MTTFSPREMMSELDRRFAVFLNPTAAGGRSVQLLPVVERCFQRLRMAYRVVQTDSIDHGCTSAGEASSNGEVVVAMGGDGLVGALADALRDTRGVLGILPTGRGNDFARVMGIPSDPYPACQILATGDVQTLDLGEANGKAFAGIASTGFDSEANRIANEAKLIRGKLVYAYSGLRALIAWRPATFRVTVDGTEHQFFGYSVSAANSRAHGGGMYVAPQADLSDGLLDVIMIHDAPKLRLLAAFPAVFSGRHVDLAHVKAVRGKEVTIDADRPFDVYADGDLLTKLPATIRAVPGALRVIAPAGRAEPREPVSASSMSMQSA